jgi:putative addiction module component (TIGR02574 family)
MSPGADAIFAAAISLPLDDRIALAEKLLDSLQGTMQREIDQAWVDEAERRLRAYEQGDSKAIPAEEVLRSLSIRKI